MLSKLKWYRKLVGGRWFLIKLLDDLGDPYKIFWSRFPEDEDSYIKTLREESYPYRARDWAIKENVVESLKEAERIRWKKHNCSEDFHNGILNLPLKKIAQDLKVMCPVPQTLDALMWALYYALEKNQIMFSRGKTFKNTIYEKIYVEMTHKGLIDCVGLNQFIFRS